MSCSVENTTKNKSVYGSAAGNYNQDESSTGVVLSSIARVSQLMYFDAGDSFRVRGDLDQFTAVLAGPVTYDANLTLVQVSII